MFANKSWLMGAVLGGLTVSACAKNPVTGNRELALISESQEIAMGQEYAKQVEASLGLVDDPGLQNYVKRVGMKLAAASERPNLPWSFAVVDDPTPNAFALPGGPIYVTRGMMSLMNSEAELAGVLGHEIGHITARHIVSQMSRQQLAQLGLGLGMILVPELQNFGNALSTGMQLLFLKYGRDDERQSDELGFKYSLQGGYDVREFDDVFAALDRFGDQQQKSALPSFLSSHPDPGERVKTAQNRVAALTAAPPSYAGQAEYMNEVEGLVYGENPRQGFFRDGVFMHPDLRFKLSFPQGWKTQNLPQAVMAGSPNQDAIIQMTLAQGNPQQAARQFLSQQGLQAGQAVRERINGKQAVMSYFQAQTQQGIVAGIATFVDHNGRTYQMIAYSSQQGLQRYDRLFRGTMASFETLTDPQALNVQPNRIDVVRLEAAMTLAEFNRRYPSTIGIDELVVINQVADANTRLPAGTQVKRVRAA